MTLLVDLQSLQAPIWKVCIWYPKVLKEIEVMENFTLQDIPTSMDKLSSNVEDVRRGLFKETKLVEGWLVVDSGDGPKESQVLNWVARELKDSEKDLKILLMDLKTLQTRLQLVLLLCYSFFAFKYKLLNNKLSINSTLSINY